VDVLIYTSNRNAENKLAAEEKAKAYAVNKPITLICFNTKSDNTCVRFYVDLSIPCHGKSVMYMAASSANAVY
jgi:hypothetical protein